MRDLLISCTVIPLAFSRGGDEYVKLDLSDKQAVDEFFEGRNVDGERLRWLC